MTRWCSERFIEIIIKTFEPVSDLVKRRPVFPRSAISKCVFSWSHTHNHTHMTKQIRRVKSAAEWMIFIPAAATPAARDNRVNVGRTMLDCPLVSTGQLRHGKNDTTDL